MKHRPKLAKFLDSDVISEECLEDRIDWFPNPVG